MNQMLLGLGSLHLYALKIINIFGNTMSDPFVIFLVLLEQKTPGCLPHMDYNASTYLLPCKS